jgi:hypothetical protein
MCISHIAQMAAPPSTTPVIVSLEQVTPGNPCSLMFANNAAVLSGTDEFLLGYSFTYLQRVLHAQHEYTRSLISRLNKRNTSLTKFCSQRGRRGQGDVQPAHRVGLHTARSGTEVHFVSDNGDVGAVRCVYGTEYA